MSTTPDKCPHCGAIRVEGREYACGFIFREGVKNNPRTHECLLNSEVSAHAATKRELEEMRARVKKFEPYYLDYVSSVSAAGLPADGPCLACNGFGGHEEGCHGTTGLMTMAYELETLRARVRELEGLATGYEEARDGGIWVEVFVPNERMGTEDLGDSVGTLRDYFPPRGEAMPRKEEA